MRISTLSLSGLGGWPALEVGVLSPGLNVVFGPPRSGKTTVADFLAHALYGQLRSPDADAESPVAPDGEATVESGDLQYRLRRSRDEAARARLTVSSLNGAAVDHQTVRRLLGNLSPLLLRRLCAISFRTPPRIEGLLSEEFAREYHQLGVGAQPVEGGRRMAELLARRDTLAKELETRLAGEGRASRDLDARRRELDRVIGQTERESATVEQRFRGVEAALTETDARLRYRRLELNADRSWECPEPANWESQLAELDEQIARWRAALAELASREATVRARWSQTQSTICIGTTTVDERAWLAVARQLAADLTGEVARLARASASDQCVCRDAHPRLRPIVETLQRQLDVLGTLIDERESASAADILADEVGHLTRSQAELRQQLEFLIARRQSLATGASPSRRILVRSTTAATANRDKLGVESTARFAAVDAEQLEQRRHELEQERFDLVNRLAVLDRQLRDLRAQRATVDRQRAALLSARSIEHVQRELATVEQKLQQLVQGQATDGSVLLPWENSPRASDILAKLTDGRFVRLQFIEQGRSAKVWTRDGDVLGLDVLSPGERDQVYLSFSLALATAAERQAVQLPLLLDEPFLRLDAVGMAALAAVLDDLSRRGRQILVFTGQAAAVERLSSLGAALHELVDLRRGERAHEPANAAPISSRPVAVRPVSTKKARVVRGKENAKKRPQGRRREMPANDPVSDGNDRSDAA